MPHLPTRFAVVILAFAPLFVHRSWQHARVLLVGAILTPGRRTVASLLRITGHSRERHFVNYHRVLSRRGGDLVLVGDSGFCALLFLDAMRRGGITAITRLRLDAALYEPAPPRMPGTIGRPRTKGARLPTLSEILVEESTRWQVIIVPGWYGAGERTIEIASATAVWRHGGLPVLPIRWVLIRDPEHRFTPQALLCTDLARDPAQIVAWFVRRWCVEVTFQEVRAHLGVETQRQWSDKPSRAPRPACWRCSRL
jgi:hypothetical protein